MPNSLPTILTRGVTEVLPSAQSLAELMAQRKIRLYLGIDPTGAFLTLGHSVVLRKLQQFADLGHEVILLIGNGTVKIGDPTGRDSTRPVLTDQVIEANFRDWAAQAAKVLDFSKIKIVHNGDWLDKLSYVDIIKLLSQTTVQQLIERDMFQSRIKSSQPIFGHEIIYPLLQGYDSVALNVDLEIGGSDQTFNMMMGRQLQRSYNNHEKWVLTTPIINGTDGRKMSKSYNNYIALTEAPNDMYGKLMSIDDTQILEYFTVLTDISDSDINNISTSIAKGENPMSAKKMLALTITAQYHSAQLAQQAAQYFEKTVQNKESPDEATLVTVPNHPITILELCKLCSPKTGSSELKRLIGQAGIEIQPSGKRPLNVLEMLDPKTVSTLKIGKRLFFKLKLKS